MKLPPPPSANRMYIKGRIKSAVYRAWITEAGYIVKKQTPVAGEVSIGIKCALNRRRDLDNFCKPILDLLVSHGIIEGDRYKTVKNIWLGWGEDEHCYVQVFSRGMA